jgi:hypothetical protein
MSTPRTGYIYFVSYMHTNGQTQTFGNVDVTVPNPITSLDRIRSLEADLRQHFTADHVVVLGYTLFSAPEPVVPS